MEGVGHVWDAVCKAKKLGVDVRKGGGCVGCYILGKEITCECKKNERGVDSKRISRDFERINWVFAVLICPED